MNQNELNNNIAVASMRLAAIQPAFNNTYPDMTKKAYYRMESEARASAVHTASTCHSRQTDKYWWFQFSDAP